MYSYEIDNYIKERNYNLNSEEYLYITNIETCPQITGISYKGDNYFEMWTNDNYFWRVNVSLYEKVLKR